ncbi:unnamed protein product, partial [Didymodactylos carnosus]
NGSTAVLHQPSGLYVVSSSGNIYVADSANQRVLRWLPGGDPATGGGLVASNTLGSPYGIVVEQTLTKNRPSYNDCVDHELLSDGDMLDIIGL